MHTLCRAPRPSHLPNQICALTTCVLRRNKLRGGGLVHEPRSLASPGRLASQLCASAEGGTQRRAACFAVFEVVGDELTGSRNPSEGGRSAGKELCPCGLFEVGVKVRGNGGEGPGESTLGKAYMASRFAVVS